MGTNGILPPADKVYSEVQVKLYPKLMKLSLVSNVVPYTVCMYQVLKGKKYPSTLLDFRFE